MGQNLKLRKTSVRKERRDCRVHGKDTEHALYPSGISGSVSWRCMRCESEQKLRIYHEIQNGTRVVEPKKVVSKQGDICKTCFQTKPLTGVCDNCD